MKKVFGMLAGLGVFTGTLLPAQAAELRWTGALSSDMLNARNWSPEVVPGPADSLTIVGQSASISKALEIDALTLLDGATLTGMGDVKVNRLLTMRASTLSGSGTFTLGPQATGSLRINADIAQNNINRPFYNEGVLNWEDGKIELSVDFYNQPSGTVNITTDAVMQAPLQSKPTFYNAGKFHKNAGLAQTTIAVYLSNSGEIIVRSGRLNMGPRFIQTGGVTKLNGGDINGTGGASLQYLGGSLRGSGQVTGSVYNDGAVVSPGFSPGAISINGSYTQTANGVLDMEIAGTTAGSQYDQINVSGTAYLAGTINLTFLNGYVPRAGDNFQLLTYAGLSGAWNTYTGFNPTDTISISKTYTPNYFVATAQVVDNELPTINVVSPLVNGGYKANPAVSGTASDGVSGVASVTVSLYRYAVGSTAAGYWNGSGWEATYAETKHERPATGTTSWSFTLPSLSDGKYCVRARAKDISGNVSASQNVIFTKDSVDPAALTVTTPADKAYVNSLSAILGTATDNTGGSGINYVDLLLKRNSDNWYWTHSGWVNSNKPVKALPETASNWARRHSAGTPLPAGINLKDGAYSLTATVYDKAGNLKSLSRAFSVDATVPTVKITAPVNNGTYATITSATGTAADLGGSTLANVKVRLYRYATATTVAGYWAGSTSWTTTYTPATNDRLASGTSSWSLTLPTLGNGNYVIEAVATDKAGNISAAPLAFFTKSAGASTAQISTISAQASANTVTLVFTSPLDKMIATDVTRYGVQVGSTYIPVQAASYNSIYFSVTLTLPTGSLQAGQSVNVTWTKLFDTVGKTVTGSGSGPVS